MPYIGMQLAAVFIVRNTSANIQKKMRKAGRTLQINHLLHGVSAQVCICLMHSISALPDDVWADLIARRMRMPDPF